MTVYDGGSDERMRDGEGVKEHMQGRGSGKMEWEKSALTCMRERTESGKEIGTVDTVHYTQREFWMKDFGVAHGDM